jgi:hypothetical protein
VSEIFEDRTDTGQIRTRRRGRSSSLALRSMSRNTAMERYGHQRSRPETVAYEGTEGEDKAVSCGKEGQQLLRPGRV